MGKIILNTDIGEDIDDTVALAMLLNSHHELLGVVTTGKKPGLKAKFARKFIRDYSQGDVPVFYGHTTVRGRSPNSAYMNERDYGFLNSDDLKSNDKDAGISSDGIEFILDQVNQNQGEVTVISIAPNTNLGEALRRDSMFASKVKEFYLMAGCISNQDEKIWKSPEYNLRQDISSFRDIVESGARVKIVGKDARLYLGREDIAALGEDSLNSVLVRLFTRFMDFFGKDIKQMYDPLTVGAYLFPEHYRFERIEPVITDRGQMFGRSTGQGNVYGCTGFDYEATKRSVLDQLKRLPNMRQVQQQHH